MAAKSAGKGKGSTAVGGSGAEKKPGRLSQIRSTYQMTKRSDPKVGLILLGTFVLVLALCVVVGLLLGNWVLGLLFGLTTGLLATTIVFGRRAERSAYRQIEGQPGAAAGVLKMLRRGWTVTPAIAATPTRDPSQAAICHRAVGRPGIVLVAEGPAAKARALLADQRKRHARVTPDVPIHEFVAGSGDGQVPLPKLQRTIVKLPRAIQPSEVTETERRLKAVGSMAMPMPKGPVPRGGRMPRGPQMRG